MDNRLDTRYFFPEIFQAVAGEDYTVYAYVNDGSIRKVDIKPFLEKGGVFEPLKDKEIFVKTLTVIGNTVAWDLEGNRDEYKCIDIDPFLVFESPVVPDIPELVQGHA
ncbi:MAG: DUF2442 domain-containing protein [Muribaculaceae bacterium]|nr:DUF2442 domain-containing protein [Roseburia sp.]MCM1430638.1 DUF2442 domain-containing protein [Muribaculaceae bacterium]MCM1491905.1 DUF2442 domain-containing protein [Muribaculaceae bacterium]